MVRGMHYYYYYAVCIIMVGKKKIRIIQSTCVYGVTCLRNMFLFR